MKIWILKAIIQKFISFLPFKHKINYLFQKHITRGVNLTDEYFFDKLEHAGNHYNYYNKYSETKDFTMLELGTGWYPVIPIFFYLAGAKKIYSIDIASHVSKENYYTAISKIISAIDNGLLEKYLPSIEQKRIDNLKDIYNNWSLITLNEISKRLQIHFIVTDARKIELKDNTIDLITSNNTFEHIPESILTEILEEFKRIIKKEGVMSHFIDMSDHFAHLDKSITIYNFLKFSEENWNFIDNNIQPQNRLRLYHYKEIFSLLNLNLTEEENRTDNLEDIKKVHLDEKFASHPIEDNAISHSHVILRK